jgi:hypothetical protein
VEEEKIFAHDEVNVGFCFHIERRGAEYRRMKPCESLA